MDREYMRKISYLAILGTLIVASFLLLRPILMSIITGTILASIFIPLYLKVLKVVKSKNLATTIISITLIILIIVPLWFITPILLNQSVEIYTASQHIDFVTPLKTLFPSLFVTEQFSNEIGATIYTFVTNITNGMMNMFAKLIMNFPTMFLQMLVAFFTFFFIVRDHETLVAYIQSILPFPKKVEEKLFKSSKDITFSVLYGQVVIGIFQGLFGGISFFLFGVENAVMLTLLACLAGIFPIIGTSIVWIPVAIYLFISGNIVAAIGVASFGVLAAFFENAIKPAFVSKRTNVHSAIILLGMIGGLLLFGILGFIIGPLILSYLLIILEIFRDKRIPGFFIQNPEDEIDIKMGYF
ncbi:MAG: AI-2E family transporter [Nanoarchaeota archaeon]|jgi:predicted PurR-regulated permease PerM|nr:AI-2E family transporter [Nanoarchaeota archaeon]